MLKLRTPFARVDAYRAGPRPPPFVPKPKKKKQETGTVKICNRDTGKSLPINRHLRIPPKTETGT